MNLTLTSRDYGRWQYFWGESKGYITNAECAVGSMEEGTRHYVGQKAEETTERKLVLEAFIGNTGIDRGRTRFQKTTGLRICKDERTEKGDRDDKNT